MGMVFLNFCMIIAFPLVLILGLILLITGFNTLAGIIEEFCSDYPSDLEYFDEDGILNKEDKKDGI